MRILNGVQNGEQGPRLIFAVGARAATAACSSPLSEEGRSTLMGITRLGSP